MPEKLRRPNFVFINTDQQRYDSLGCYGSPVARTPNIDRIAHEGIRFSRCYTTNPVCMPARASYFTGQYPSHHGVWQNGVPLDPHADTLQRALGRAGYHTALIGKIHLDNVWKRTEKHPSYGFDLLIECEGDPYCKDDYFKWLDAQDLYDAYMTQFKREGHNAGYTREIDEEKHMNNWITDHVGDYLDQKAHDCKPFFLSVGFFDPHHPFDPCEPYASMFEAEEMPMPIYSEGEEETMTPLARARFDGISDFCLDPSRMKKTIAAYHATIAHVDAMVGRIMDKLRATGLEENTVVIFTSDHGEMLGDHGILHKGPLFYEGAARVPLIWRFPQRCRRTGLDNAFISHVDLAPTVCTLADVPGLKRMQGVSLFDDELTLRPTPPRDAALIEWREKPYQSQEPFLIGRCLVTDRWKYVHYHDRPWGELYDLESDPEETKNLWGDRDHIGTVRALQERLLAFILESEPVPERTDIF